MNGFTLFHKDRLDKRGGGVALYARNDLRATLFGVESTPSHLEIIWVKTNLSNYVRNSVNLFICVVYSPPGTPLKEEITEHIIYMSDHIRNSFLDAAIIILGDFNDLATEPFVRHLNVEQLVKQPTRENRILDMIFTDCGDFYKKPLITAPIGSSDHSTVLMIPRTSCPISTTRCSYRPMRDSCVRSFGRWITSYDFRYLDGMESPDDMVQSIQSVLGQAYRQHFPLVVRRRSPNDKPWITDRLKSLIRKRQRAFELADRTTFMKLRNQIQRKIKQRKSVFYQKKIAAMKKSSPGKWHRQLRSLAGLNKRSSFNFPNDFGTSPSEQAKHINDFFANICRELPALDISSCPAFLPARRPPPRIQRFKIFEMLKKLNPSKAVHPEDIPIQLIREFAFELSAPLSVIFNVVLDRGSFPSRWKRSVITPIPKSYPVTCCSDLRPISITPILARVFEGFLSQFLIRDLTPHLDPRQFGNIRGSSTTHYLVSLMDTILRGMDKPRKCATLCTIDFSKAFDRVNHNVVIHKLIKYGVDEAILSTVISFLSDRTQSVRIGPCISEELLLTCGVPQGTKLGPLIFLTLVNDALMDFDQRWKYVDDLSILEVRSTSGVSTLADHLDKLTCWSKENDMKFNVQKSKTMSTDFSKNRANPPSLHLNNQPMEDTNCLKLLGVLIQANLKWDSHISDVVSRAGRRIFMICRLRKASVPMHDLVNIYSTYIRPLLEYACPLWSTSITTNQIYDIERIQKRICRIILRDQYISYEHALETLGINRMSERHEQLLLSFAKSLLASSRHRDFLPPLRSEISSRRLRYSHHLDTPMCRTARYRSSTMPSAIRVLNANL